MPQLEITSRQRQQLNWVVGVEEEVQRLQVEVHEIFRREANARELPKFDWSLM